MDEKGQLQECFPSGSHLGRFEPSVAFNVLRREEYADAIRQAWGELPDVPAWQLFEKCRDLYCQLDRQKAYHIFKSKLQARTAAACKQAAVLAVPPSLKAAALGTRMAVRDWKKLPLALANVAASC